MNEMKTLELGGAGGGMWELEDKLLENMQSEEEKKRMKKSETKQHQREFWNPGICETKKWGSLLLRTEQHSVLLAQ